MRRMVSGRRLLIFAASASSNNAYGRMAPYGTRIVSRAHTIAQPVHCPAEQRACTMPCTHCTQKLTLARCIYWRLAAMAETQSTPLRSHQSSFHPHRIMSKWYEANTVCLQKKKCKREQTRATKRKNNKFVVEMERSRRKMHLQNVLCQCRSHAPLICSVMADC